MKAAVGSGIILISIILLIIANSFYCIGVTEELKRMISPEGEMTENEVSALEEYWEKREMMLHLGVNSEYTDTVSESIISLKSAIKTGSTEDIEREISLLKFRVERLEKLNRLDLVNIF